MTKKKHVLALSNEARDKVEKRKEDRHTPLDQRTRDKVLALVQEGATLAEVCNVRKVTSWGKLFATRQHDRAFDGDVRQALAVGAEAAIGEAQEASKEAALSGNPDLMRVAESFSRVSTVYAEKIAPREFGQLVKLGNPDGGALALAVVNYNVPAISLSGDNVGKSPQLVDGSRARAIDAGCEELDAQP